MPTHQNKLLIKVYERQNSFNLILLLKEIFHDVLNSRFLAFQLAKRDISSQYRQSFFGILWAFVPAIATASVWIFLNYSGTVSLTDTNIPYPIYVISGTLLWSIITEAITSPIQNITASKSLLTKINFPKEALIISGILKLLFHSSVKIVLIIGLIFFFGLSIKWNLMLFPIAILGGLIMGTTIGLLLTPIGMLYHDISRFIAFGMQLTMYATPVVYAVPKAGMMKTLMELNPFTPIITVGRSLVVGLEPQYLTYFIVLIAICIPLFFLALVFFRISIPIFVERLSA